MGRPRVLVLAAAVAAGAATALLVPLASAQAQVTPHGTSSIKDPYVLVDFWGSQFSPTGSMARYANYVEGFLGLLTVSHAPPLDTLEQYGYSGQIEAQNDVDDVLHSVPAEPTESQLAAEVAYADDLGGIFYGSGPASTTDAITVIVLPPGHDPSWFPSHGGPFCEANYYSYVNARQSPSNAPISGYQPWIVLPYQPDSSRCWHNDPNPTNDSFGNGSLDGVSHVLYAGIGDMITDENGNGWFDSHGTTVSNLCVGDTTDWGEPGDYYAIQALYSNEGEYCYYGTTPSLSMTGNPNFGSQARYTSSPKHTITITANGDGSVVLGPDPWILFDLSDNFSVSGNTCPALLPPGGSCHAQVQFAPHGTGSDSASLAVFGTGAKVVALHLTGTGVLPRPGPVLGGLHAFKTTLRGAAVVHLITVANKGKKPLRFRRLSVAGADAADFAIVSDGCGQKPLAPGASCTVGVRFAPRVTGALRALVLLRTSAQPIAFVVSGKGAGAAESVTGRDLSDGSLAFPATPGLGLQAGQPVTVKSTGQLPLNIRKVRASGPFEVVDHCPDTLRRGRSCTVTVRPDARSYGPLAGKLTITTDAAPATVTIGLIGDAEADWAQALPASVTIDPAPVKQVSSATVLVETGGGPGFKIRSVTLSGSSAFSVKNGCPAVLKAPSCAITVSVEPNAFDKTFTGTLTIVTSAQNGTLQVPLSATSPD
jgi:hypothetical protein